eukprot:5601200-Amphidinium_carterae.1
MGDGREQQHAGSVTNIAFPCWQGLCASAVAARLVQWILPQGDGDHAIEDLQMFVHQSLVESAMVGSVACCMLDRSWEPNLTILRPRS